MDTEMDKKELEEILAKDCLEDEPGEDLGKDGELYKEMYYKMFNRITDVIEEMKQLQIELEEMYVNGGEE